MPLSFAPTERAVKVVKILADEKTKKHLESLGITVNSEMNIVMKSNGSIICQIKNGRLALDKNIASKILVA